MSVLVYSSAYTFISQSNCSLFSQNAMRAVVEQHGSSVDIPPLKVLITKGRQDLTVKVCNWCVNSSKFFMQQCIKPHFYLPDQLSIFLKVYSQFKDGLWNSCFNILSCIASDALFFFHINFVFIFLLVFSPRELFLLVFSPRELRLLRVRLNIFNAVYFIPLDWLVNKVF